MIFGCLKEEYSFTEQLFANFKAHLDKLRLNLTAAAVRKNIKCSISA